VSENSAKLHLEQLGPTEQAAIRTLLDTFRDHGWRDTANAALLAVRKLASSPRGLSPSSVAAVIPDGFYLQNDVTKRELGRALASFTKLERATACKH
jgi:hypothetical protein